MNSPIVSMFNESNELVRAPVTVSPPFVVATAGVTVTVVAFTLGLSGAPLFSTPTPVTEYSHPVL